VSDEQSVHWHGWCETCKTEVYTYTCRATGQPRCPICGTDLESFTIHQGVSATVPTEDEP